ncbi:hypothetical protein ACXR2U_03590 [Jatrophihabitans sp. YIM 134969]
MTPRLRFGTRTIGAAYLVVGAGSGAGALLGGGTVAVVWAATCGAMGAAWLAPTDAVVRTDHLRLPRVGFRHRDVPFAELERITTPHPWSTDPLAYAHLRDGSRLPLRGLGRDDLARVAATAGVPLEVGVGPRSSATR